MSNKQNDELYDTIRDIPGLAELITIVREISGHTLDFDEMGKLNDWLLKTRLNQIEVCREAALKVLTKRLTT